MGGRGSSSLGGGGVGAAGVRGLINAFSKANGGQLGSNVGTGAWGSQLNVSPAQLVGDYDDNGNAQLQKWQNQTDDKSASFLAKTWNDTDLNQIQQNTNDKWSFYNNPQQKLVEQLGLNAKTTVMSESDLNQYIKQTGATTLWRGWSGQDSIDRFTQSPNSHIGNGINGDGYYFAADKSTAKSYGGTGMKAALSPTARVVNIDTVNTAISNASSKFKKSLGIAGSQGTRTYGSNSGQAQMALKMGFNVIDAGWAVIPLTRDAVIVSSKNAW